MSDDGPGESVFMAFRSYTSAVSGVIHRPFQELYIGRFRSYTSAVSGVMHRPFQELCIGRFRIYSSAVSGFIHRPFQELYIGRFRSYTSAVSVVYGVFNVSFKVVPLRSCPSALQMDHELVLPSIQISCRMVQSPTHLSFKWSA
jgi:hypothetical protein